MLPEIIASLGREPNLVIEAPPGAGKTTRVPAALLDAGLAGEGEVWVLEPRRLAARLAARRVAEERDEQLGRTVGYQVRFEEVASRETRLRFLTEGVFTRRLLADPQLSHASVVVLDEFHERHLQADLALALLMRLQHSKRTDLRIVAMSATLDAAPVARFLDNCPVLSAEGRRFPVEIKYDERHDERPLEIRVAESVRRLVSGGLEGDVLVFLPGAAEIRRAQNACASLAAEFNFDVTPLHGDMPAAEQDRAVQGAERRKVILSTNVAETSVTIEGVAAVVDSGLARVAGHSPWSGLPTLHVARVSRASATQRAGRAGRTRAGIAVRLYTAQDFAQRPEHELPEIQRLDLTEAALELHAGGVTDLESFEWFEAPERASLEAADALLDRLGAIDAGGRLTETGRRMSRLPLHPRLSRMIVEADARGVAAEACLIAALVSERDIRARHILQTTQAERVRPSAASHSPSDLLELFDLFMEAERARFAPERLQRMNLDPSALKRVDRVRRQLERLTASGRAKDELSSEEETQVLISILAGYPDRVARRGRSSSEDAGGRGAVEVLLSGGGGAQLATESVVRGAEFMVAVDAEERREAGRATRRGGRTLVRLASAIEPEWLLDLFTDDITETTVVEWNEQLERVETVKRLMYDQLVLDETRTSEAGSAEVARVLAERALAAGPEVFVDNDVLRRFLARVRFVRRTFPEKNFPELNEIDVRSALVALCEERRSFAELREAAREGGGILEALRRRLSADELQLLARLAPERVRLARCREVRVNYEDENPPWIASRLQDFFGMREGPKVGGGRVALVLHLLAPSQRPVQVTTDLAGFWERHYQSVRRELSRRYPRHAWPADPLKEQEESKQ